MAEEPVIEVPRAFNAANLFIDRHLAEGRAGRVAIQGQDRAWTYGELAAEVNRVGNALRGSGVQMEQRVLMICLDCPEFVATFFGAIKIGAVPVPVNTMMRSPDYAYFLQDTRAGVLVISESLLGEVGPVLGSSPYLRQVVVIGRPQEGGPVPQIAYADWIAGASDRLDAAATTCDDVAFWLYSSGSTGAPKGTVHLQHDMVYAAELYARGILGIHEGDRCFSASKLFFAYGLGNGMYFPLYVGGSTVLFPGRPVPADIYGVIDRHRPTLFFGVPTLYAAMLQVPGATERYDLSSLRLCVSAGEALPPEIYRRWLERWKVEILDGIGSTEVLHIYISNRPGRVKPGTSGTLVPGYRARIVDEEGREVPRGEVGDLLVAGDSTAAAYWNRHGQTKEKMRGEWFFTGDKYYQDEEGYFVYAGRSDDMLKVGGVWVSPIEVENALLEHPAVLEAAVVGREDEEGLVKPKAYVVLKEGERPSSELEAELKEFVKGRIAPYKYPRWIEFIDELPKTATGKIQRFKLRAS